MKFRQGSATLNITAFSAKANDLNTQIITISPTELAIQQIIRVYSAKGFEVEAGVRRGPFSLTAGATYTNSKIASDAFNPSFVGNKPRNQPNLLFNLAPVFSSGKVSVGANLFHTGGSFAQDVNQLRIPGYTVVNGFIAVRPTERLELGLRVNNLFNKLAITGVQDPTLPLTGLTLGNVLPGRGILTTARLSL
jgi:outer membrane receptor protein involved in Fe transport